MGEDADGVGHLGGGRDQLWTAHGPQTPHQLSLYLQTAKGAQHRRFGRGDRDSKEDAESCDTSDNDYGRAEEWWKRLKQHMDLSDSGEGGESSQGPMRASHLPTGGHSDEQVQCWEAERQELLREQAAELEDQLKFEKEEAEDIEKDEQRWEQHAASSYRDWEQMGGTQHANGAKEEEADDCGPWRGGRFSQHG